MQEGIYAAGNLFASYFGGWTVGLSTLVIFMAIDYLSGLAVTKIFHKRKKTAARASESKAALKDLCRKSMTLLFVLIAHRLDLVLDFHYLRHAVIIGFLANELISIAENAVLMGLSLPGAVTKMIDTVVSKRGDGKQQPESEQAASDTTKTG